MEENRYACPQCGIEMNVVYEKPALNLTCPKCGCKIATTKWEDIDLDDTDYEIILKPITCPSTNQIKAVSNLTGQNFIASKNLLREGGPLFKVKAVDLKDKTALLDRSDIIYFVSPEFPY